MSWELLNTSVPRGVRLGSHGFCTVAMTAGLPPALEERLTLLSGYRWLVPSGEPGSEQNPVAYAHWRLSVGGRPISVLSRVCDAGFDFSRRSNRFAHHVALEAAEQPEPGPAWVMMQPGVMHTDWRQDPMVFGEGPDIPVGATVPRICQAWAAATGDAGWAGALAESFANDPANVTSIIFPLGVNALALVDEAISLLPPALRWQATFCTYFTDLPAGMTCAWRFCVSGTRSAEEALRSTSNGSLLIDLTAPLPPAPDSPYAFAARNGTVVEQIARAAPALPRPETRKSVALFSPPAADDSSMAVDLPIEPGIGQEEFADNKPDATLRPFDASGRAHLSKRPAGGLARGGRRFPIWAALLGWGIIAGVSVWVAWHSLPGFLKPSPTAVVVPQVKPVSVAVAAAPTTSAADPDSVSAAVHQTAISELASARQNLAEQEGEISRLKESVRQLKDDLAAATIAAKSGQSSREELEKLRAGVADLQARLDPASKSAPVSRDRTVEVLRDEVELWPGDGNGPPDLIQLDSYKTPDMLIVDRSSGRIVLKTASATVSGVETLPVELGVIKIDGPRVVLNWFGTSRTQLSASIRVWLQFAQLTIQRQGQTAATVRFLPLRTVDLTVDNETSASLFPDVRGKDALQHIGWANPSDLPAGWEAASKDQQTLTITSPAHPSATFDVQLQPSPSGELLAHTTFAPAYLRLHTIAAEAFKDSEKKQSLADQLGKKVAALADKTGEKPKDPSRSVEFEAARRDLAAAQFAQHDAESLHDTADAAATDLRTLPAFSLSVINRENGLVLSTVRIQRTK